MLYFKNYIKYLFSIENKELKQYNLILKRKKRKIE